MKPRFPAVGVLLSVVVFYGLAFGGSDQPPSPTAGNSTPQQTYPDDGYLSNYRYANAYFGFSFDLPAEAELLPVPVPFPNEGQIPLLELLGSVPQRAVVSIVAFPPGEKRAADAKALLRKDLDRELTIGVEELRALSKTNISGHLFYTFETRHGVDQHAVYATELNGYLLRIVVAARNPKLVQQLQSSVLREHFFSPDSIGQYAGVGAAAYQGPTIPSHVLQQLKSDPPAARLDAGGMQGSGYNNRELGLVYQLPDGWTLGPEGAVIPAITRNREQTTGLPALGTSERALLKACERTLISAWKATPEKDGGDVAYEDFGEVTVSAVSLACFPNVKFPDTLDERTTIRDFLVAYGQTHPIVRDMKGARAFEHAGRIFVVMEGVIAYQIQGDSLSRRVSVALALTRQRGYLLSFFFAAPHESELRQLMEAKAVFEPEPPTQEAKASLPGRDAAAAKEAVPGGSTSSTEMPPPSSAQAAPQATSPSTQNASAAPPKDEPAQAGAPADTPPTRPSLLKPGETMQDQQMKGAPLPKK